MNNQDLFKGKNVLVTGATSGIGAEIAKQLHELGAVVHGIGRQENQDFPGVDHYIQIDLSDLAQIEDKREELQELFSKGLHYFFGIAAAPSTEPIGMLDMGNFASVMNTNFMANVSLTNILAEQMKAGNCRVVFASSGATDRVLAGQTAYATSKSALEQFTRYIAQELNPEVTAISVILGAVATPIWSKAGIPDEAMQAIGQALAAIVPDGNPVMTAEEVASAIITLAGIKQMNSTKVRLDKGIAQLLLPKS